MVTVAVDPFSETLVIVQVTLVTCSCPRSSALNWPANWAQTAFLTPCRSPFLAEDMKLSTASDGELPPPLRANTTTTATMITTSPAIAAMSQVRLRFGGGGG